MTYDSVVALLAERLGPPVFTAGSEVRFNCFKEQCGASRTPDTKYHMYVNPDKKRFFCQRCQSGGSLDYLFRSLGLTLPGDSLTTWESTMRLFLYGPSKAEREDAATADLPEDFAPLPPGSRALSYLEERGISPFRSEAYGIGIGTKRFRGVPKEQRWRYAGRNRIVLPDVDSAGEVVYWVARTYAGHKAKYKNAQAPRELQVYNLGRIQARKFRDRIVICEGPISALVAGYDAVATYGKYVTGAQLARLADFDAAEYVVAFDGDAIPEGASLASRLFKRGKSVRFVRFSPDEDPASVGPREIRRRIHGAKPWTPMSAAEVLV